MQMHRLAESIVKAGRKATLIQDTPHFHPGWFTSNVTTISHESWIKKRDSSHFSTDNILIFPETYISSVKDYSRGLPSVIFNQNSSYTFGVPGSASMIDPRKLISLYMQPNIKNVLCVSSYDYNFLSSHILRGRINVSRIINGLEDSVFHPFSSKRRQILYMPRKNAFDSHIVSSLLASSDLLSSWSVMPIHKVAHSKVLEMMRSSLLFLSFGHPEGFGLPVAEALSSGCAVVGYSGLGGRELFEVGRKFSMAEEIQYGDWSGFVHAAEHFELSLRRNSVAVHTRLKLLSTEMQSLYNMNCMHNSILTALETIESCI